MNAAQLVLLGCGTLLAGAGVTALVSGRRGLVGPLALLFVLASAVFSLPAALRVLATNQSAATSPLTLPTLGAAFSFSVDQLTAVFLIIVSVISTLTTLYSISYLRCHPGQHLVRYYPLLLLFFAGIMGLVCMADWFFFLVFWEFMTLCSYFLVIFDRENPTSQRAGLKYMVITHVATGLMLVAVLLLWKLGEPHSFSFAAARETMARLAETRPALLHTLLALWFLGFATKAGVLPFGDWLPDAYPAAPSSASAAFGGTMTKLGVYGVLRVFLGMLPVSEYSVIWGTIIALFGAGSIFVGTLTALVQGDAKRLMAFHVIGQIGYMLLAIGAGLALLPSHPVVGFVALLGGLFHVINHVCYKTLLFLSAGSIELRTGHTDLHRVGGLARVMPVTAVTALVGSLSIAGVPPLNGFASKWLIYNATLLGGISLPVFLILGIVAVFISLVTLASFLKFLGAAFLGEQSPLTGGVARQEVPFSMLLPQLVLAALCLGFGLAPLLPLAGLYRALTALGALSTPPSLEALVGNSWLGLRLSFVPGETTGVWLPVVGCALLAIMTALAYGLSRLGAAERRSVELWHCGTLPPGEQARYPAHSLYGAFKAAFRNVYPSVPAPRANYPVRLMSIFDLDRWLIRPILRFGERVIEVTSHTHSGIPQLYLSWQIAGLIIVVVVLFFLAR